MNSKTNTGLTWNENQDQKTQNPVNFGENPGLTRSKKLQPQVNPELNCYVVRVSETGCTIEPWKLKKKLMNIPGSFFYPHSLYFEELDYMFIL